MKPFESQYLKWILNLGLAVWLFLQSGCIVISTAGAVTTTAVKSTVSVARHTTKAVADVVTPDSDNNDN